MTCRGQTPPRLGGVGGVADHVDRAAGEPGGEQIDHFPGQLWLPGPLGVGLALRDVLAARLPEPEQDRQAHRRVRGTGAARRSRPRPSCCPTRPPAGRCWRSRRGARSSRGPCGPAGAAACRRRRRAPPLPGSQNRSTISTASRSPSSSHRPARVAEEPVGAARDATPPTSRRPDQHPRHGAQPGLRDLTDHQRPERPERRSGEARPTSRTSSASSEAGTAGASAATSRGSRDRGATRRGSST